MNSKNGNVSNIPAFIVYILRKSFLIRIHLLTCKSCVKSLIVSLKKKFRLNISVISMHFLVDSKLAQVTNFNRVATFDLASRAIYFMLCNTLDQIQFQKDLSWRELAYPTTRKTGQYKIQQLLVYMFTVNQYCYLTDLIHMKLDSGNFHLFNTNLFYRNMPQGNKFSKMISSSLVSSSAVEKNRAGIDLLLS